jgi:hypothetical protein
MSTDTDAKLARLRELSARSLEERMSDISEDHYAAGWMSGLQYDLWQMLRGGPRYYGMGSVSEADVTELRRLSEDAGGWHDGNRLVPLDEWRREFARYFEHDWIPSARRHAAWVRAEIGNRRPLGIHKPYTEADADEADRGVERLVAELPAVKAEAE